jgi:predicted nucleotidyltransferase
MDSGLVGPGPAARTGSLYRPVVDVLKKTFGDRLKTVVLFGSQARGTSLPESDHDLLVVIAGLPSDRLRRQWTVRETLLPILDRLPGSVAFVTKTPEELHANLTPLLLDVCVEGICLYGQKYFESYREKAHRALRQSGLKQKRIGSTLMWVFPDFRSRAWELTWEGYRELP